MDIQAFEDSAGRKFVSHLFWQSLPPEKARAAKQIKQLAADLQFDLIVHRTTTQAGFARSGGAYADGVLSAAAMLSKTAELENLGRNVLIAVNVGNGNFLRFVQHEGATLPTGDTIGSADEIRATIIREIAATTYDTIIAPQEWQIPNAQFRDFNSFYPTSKSGSRDYKRWWGLRPIAPVLFTRKRLLYFVLLPIMVFIACYSIQRWHKARVANQQKIEREKAQQQAIAQLPPVQLKPAPHPWKDMPRAVPFASACTKALQGIRTYFPGGWSFREATCVGKTLVVVWTRPANGRIDYLRQAEPNAVFSSDFTTATLSIPIEFALSPEESLPPSAARAAALADIAQVLSLQAKTSIAAPPVMPAAAPNEIPTLPPDWLQQSWSIAALDRNVVDTVSAIDANGFRIVSMQMLLTNNKFVWNLEGMQYAK